MNILGKELDLPADKAAKRLLGCSLIRTIGDQDIVCRIVETEAYDQIDPASHSFRGPTPRTAVMFGPAGYAYVYFTYGMYYCVNIVVGPNGHGEAVLIRAVEPLTGLDLIKANRQNIVKETMLTNGPGKLCQALAIDKTFSGQDLSKKPLRIELKPALKLSAIVTTTRIGISKAKDVLGRFYIKDNPYVSRYN